MSKIAQYGNDCNIIRNSTPVYNQSTNSYESEPIVITGKGLKGNYSLSNIDNTVIQVGDVKIIACFNNGAPIVNDAIDFDGTIYKVVSISEVNPDGKKAIYYTLQCRR